MPTGSKCSLYRRESQASRLLISEVLMRRLCLAIAFLIPLLIPRASYGCSCIEQGPAVAFNAAKAVFIGRMLGGTESLSVQDGKGESRTIEAGEVRFTVEEAFKGGLGTEATIRVASNKGTSC